MHNSKQTKTIMLTASNAFRDPELRTKLRTVLDEYGNCENITIIGENADDPIEQKSSLSEAGISPISHELEKRVKHLELEESTLKKATSLLMSDEMLR